jgi:hypothetical protein
MKKALPIVSIILWAIFIQTSTVSAQITDLEPAAVRIINPVLGTSGGGFVFRRGGEDGSAYVLTCEHIVTGTQKVKVTFFAQPDKSVEGSVVRVSRGKDLAIIKVSDPESIPPNTMIMVLSQPNLIRPGITFQIINYSNQNDLWSILQGSVDAVRDEVINADDPESVRIIRFSANVKEGDSGSALVLDDQVIGIVRSGVPSGPDHESATAIHLSVIQEFLQDLLPKTATGLWGDKPFLPRLPVTLDENAKLCAMAFLDLVIQDKLEAAYNSTAAATRERISESTFVGMYSRFAATAARGIVERTVGDVQDLSFPPTAPEVATHTYVIVFETKYKADPTAKSFETVTVIKEGGTWKVFWFLPNRQAVQSGEVDTVSSQENAIKTEALAALQLLHENQLSKLYRDKFADLQKRSLMTTEAKAISILTPIVQAGPGGPAERTVLFLRSMDKMSTLFPDVKGEFYEVVFLARYTDSKYQETVFLVKEQNAWKIVAIYIVRAL